MSVCSKCECKGHFITFINVFVAADDTQTDCAKTVVNGNIDDNVFAKKSFICHGDHKKNQSSPYSIGSVTSSHKWTKGGLTIKNA